MFVISCLVTISILSRGEHDKYDSQNIYGCELTRKTPEVVR